MLSKRLPPTVSAHERRFLQYQWLRSGKCARCFHASFRVKAEESSNDSSRPTPANAPQTGSTRQQRAAMVSKEVEMLQRDRPSPSFGEADPDTLRPPGASQTVDPEAVGLNMGGGSMGANDTRTQEGPYAQGFRVEARSDVDAVVDTRAARSTGQPVTVESASERGGSGLESGLGSSSGARLHHQTKQKPKLGTGGNDDGVLAARTRPSQTVKQQTSTSTAAQPSTPTKDAVFPERRGSTLAANNFRGVIEDRLNAIAELDFRRSERSSAYLARKLSRGQFVQFVSKEERAAALDEAKRARGSPTVREGEAGKPASSGELQKILPLPESVQNTLIDSLVSGKYDGDARLHAEGKFKQPVLNDIARTTTMNGTYLRQDGDRLLAKVRSLLPASGQQPQQKTGR